MQGYAGVRGKKSEVFGESLLTLRKVRAKMELFSPTMLTVMGLFIMVAIFLGTNSYLKSYRKSQLVKIGRFVDANREAGFKKNELEGRYLRMMSAGSLMKKAGKLGMETATRERVIKL